MRQFARRFVLLAGASIVAGCLSPTLPLPPPVEPEVAQIGEGRYLITGEIPEPGAVYILNKRTEDGVLAITDKKYALEVTALPKDPMQVWYEVANEKSDIVEFEIPDRPPSPAPDGGTN